MEIIDVYVEDRRNTHGEYTEPIPVLKVSEPVQERHDAIHCGKHFRKISCGPFWAIEYCPVLGTWEDANRYELSRFNTLNLHPDQLMPVIASHPEEENLWLTMSVRRVRRLLRKHHDTYEVIVDETSAFKGRLNWRVELKEPLCFVQGCRVAPTTVSWYGGAHVNHCAKHLEQFNREYLQRNGGS